jgi:hypothetical protein
LVTEYTVDLLIALEEGERPSRKWWAERYQRAAVRAGGMPPAIADPTLVALKRVRDPDSGDRLARVTLPFPSGTALDTARELAHMLTSVFACEGYTLRSDGEKVETLPGDRLGPPEGSFGGMAFGEGRVCSSGCDACVVASENRLGCCGQGGAFSLADVGAALLAGDDEVVANYLALPGQRDGAKWHPYLHGGACVYHDRTKGCTLSPARMPLQCRTYLCLPEKLLPPTLLPDYTVYVDALEDAETFVEEHMREHGGVDFDSPLGELKQAAARAFADWASEAD